MNAFLRRETYSQALEGALALEGVRGSLFTKVGQETAAAVVPAVEREVVYAEYAFEERMVAQEFGAAARGEFNFKSFADEIVSINKATDGGGVLLNGTPSSAINSAMYYETAAEQGASIFRSISGGHMFMNGNKRTAVAAFQSFAKQHGLTPVSRQQMMNVATQVATGKITDISQIAKMLTK
ncbi:hypothetical protein [Arsenicibacter rosenii]|uniref:Fido domain-containing protein n=1 Tax=Arsenicibacter rosenii TaxID=1750698 RepID=A0A1S2VA49_9BACT|nr:hypothetical protein [Arsenicibacter rosenii]OIN55617.1 hypothetical protein BLX24_29185 [Arsenicibacter rosenii]